MGMSLKQIRQQAMNLSNAKGDKREKVLIRAKIREFNREIEIHARIKDELAEFFKEKVSKINEPVLRREVESMWKSFERILDKKDHQIQYMTKLMTIAEDQLQYAVEFNCSAMDNMIHYYFRALEALAEENKKRSNKRFRCEEDFNENISISQKLADIHLQILIYDAHSKAESQKLTQRGIHSMTKQDERKKNANKHGNMHQYFLKTFFEMWNEYRSIFRSYVNNTTDINKEVRKLREKDKVMAGVIAAQTVQLQQSDSMIKQLRSELQTLESIQRTELHARINNYRDACKRLKITLSEVCKSGDKQIKFLVSESNSAMDWLESARKKGEAILKLAALSRKYETQREKVIPFANTLATEDSTHELEAPTLTKKILANNSGLTRLWQRISNAKLSYKALHHEKILLEYENTVLSQKIRGKLNNSEINKYVSELKNSNESIVTLEGVLEVQKYTIEYILQ